MRLTSFSFLSGLAALGLLAFPALAEDEAENVVKPTYFDSVMVPPLTELTPDNFKEVASNTKWLFVKHYSPYCHHCISYAPYFQTTYEYYYTSKPEGAGDKSFTDFYDFKFAAVNCIAYSDLCVENGVKLYPTTILYENGKEVKSVTGGQNITFLSGIIEEALEKSKPGSRPRSLALPLPGEKESPESEPETALKSGTEGKKPKKPVATPNEDGVSVSLTAENFQRLVTMTQDPWFIKFYAPWCPHCQDMAPTWEQLAKSMKGKLNIGEVNCDKESRLCKDVGARAFPTILFFKGGERSEYEGLRGLGDFIQYAENAVDLASGVPDVDLAAFKALEQKEDVIFVYFYDHATTSEDFNALERLPLSLIGHAKLVKTKDPAMYERFKITTWPRFMVSREGRPTYYPPLTPNAMRDTHQVLDWMRSVWLPLVPELLVTNARQIMEGKIVVLGVLNRDDQESFQGALREMKSAANEWMDRQIQEFQLERKKLRDAKQMRIEEAEDRDDQRALRAAKAIHVDMSNSGRREVAFAWVDGVAWQRWIRTTYGIDVKDGERVIINDQDNRKYWDSTVTGNYILVSRTSILETLDKVVYTPQALKPKLTISSFEKIFFDIRVSFTEHPYLTLGCIVGIAFGVFSWLRGRSRRGRGHFRLEDSISIRDFKEGFLGGSNGNTKAD
ncbi:thioredoxin protein [Trichoderma citrinoviride]|uniref:Thioredoxin protein n=1 Tax=Trichoderma citrinoviride TaxID=58853 RepID=A0A2T4BMQ0_9HYPO|nr:thioredoxin protein [Trichoderma citrinoviride]PTB70583.1 thioredoxin protein [Trichoderma citrinoviride]